jgi:hypothetical protein
MFRIKGILQEIKRTGRIWCVGGDPERFWGSVDRHHEANRSTWTYVVCMFRCSLFACPVYDFIMWHVKIWTAYNTTRILIDLVNLKKKLNSFKLNWDLIGFKTLSGDSFSKEDIKFVMAVTMNIVVLWDATPCSLVELSSLWWSRQFSTSVSMADLGTGI